MEGFYLQDGHAKPLPDGVEPEATPAAAEGRPAPLPAAQREVTAILLETASLPGLPPELTGVAVRGGKPSVCDAAAPTAVAGIVAVT